MKIVLGASSSRRSPHWCCRRLSERVLVSVTFILDHSGGDTVREREKEGKMEQREGRQMNWFYWRFRSCGDRGDRQPFTFWQACVPSPSASPLGRVVLFLPPILFLSLFLSFLRTLFSSTWQVRPRLLSGMYRIPFRINLRRNEFHWWLNVHSYSLGYFLGAFLLVLLQFLEREYFRDTFLDLLFVYMYNA